MKDQGRDRQNIEDVEKLRRRIDAIQSQIKDLLTERVQISQQIWKHKIENEINLQDSEREQKLIHQFDQEEVFKKDPLLKNYYHQLVRHLIDGNKKYLAETILKTEQEKVQIER